MNSVFLGMQNATNNEIKLLRKLGQKKYRQKEQSFLVEGIRAVEQVLGNNLVDVHSVFVRDTAVSDLSFIIINAEPKRMDAGVFDEISDTENTQGVIALCRMPQQPKVNVLAKKEGLIIATDAIQDPGNMGSIIRTAAWFGAKAIIAGKGSVDVYHPKVVRSTAGATGSTPVLQETLLDILDVFESRGWQSLLLDAGKNAKSLREIERTSKTILVVGNEGNGVSEELLQSFREKVKIESAGSDRTVESLNAAMAVGIALYALGGE
ncbi:MAG: RNA methyltransferase [Balneolaceae bacterium]|nr:RNA methyltransferase [Balneolaceae bacterium]